MKKRIKLILAVIGSIAVLVLMFMWLTGNLSGEEKIAPEKVKVREKTSAGLRTVTIESLTVPVEIEAVGTVGAREKAEISSRIMAQIVDVKVDAGDAVEKGSPLLVLDSRDAEARLTQAHKALASAEAVLERASLDAGRIERLLEKHAATKQEHDQSRAMLKTAQAAVDTSKAAVREAEVYLSHTKIASPISGIVIDRFSDAGDMAAPGRPLISIYDPSTLRMEVALTENLREKVELNQTLKASIDSIGDTFNVTIEEIVPASDAMSRSFLVRVSIREIDGVYPGMYGRIWVPLGTKESVFIPPETVQHIGQLETVIVVKDGTARTRTVKTGKEYPEGIEIISGLLPGEMIAFP
jgi:RND family efflux transporter MFP subunit